MIGIESDTYVVPDLSVCLPCSTRMDLPVYDLGADIGLFPELSHTHEIGTILSIVIRFEELLYIYSIKCFIGCIVFFTDY